MKKIVLVLLLVAGGLHAADDGAAASKQLPFKSQLFKGHQEKDTFSSLPEQILLTITSKEGVQVEFFGTRDNPTFILKLDQVASNAEQMGDCTIELSELTGEMREQIKQINYTNFQQRERYMKRIVFAVLLVTGGAYAADQGAPTGWYRL